MAEVQITNTENLLSLKRKGSGVKIYQGGSNVEHIGF